MANMREIRLRIKSVSETRQITKAMKLIYAAKLKKARQQLEQTLPYFDKVRATMTDILTHSAGMESAYFDMRKEKTGRRAGYIIIAGDKGLAGGYNHNVIKLAENKLEDAPDALLFVVGNVGRSHFSRGKYTLYEDFDYAAQNPTVYRAREIAEMVIGLFNQGEIDEVHLIYTLMESTLKMEPVATRLLPLDLSSLKEDLKVPEEKAEKPDESLLYEPSPDAVFRILVPKYLKGIIYGALVESFTSECSARMTAMDNATANADEMLDKLNLFYNRARQAAITQEISEIVGGAQALETS